MRKLHRRARTDRGAVAVEFALILPVLLLIVVGTIEFGRVYSQVQVYNGAAREGARCAAVMATPFAAGCNSTTAVQTRIDNASDPYPDPPNAVISPAGGCTDTTIGHDVSVSWDQPLTLSIPFWGDIDFTSPIEATFRCE